MTLEVEIEVEVVDAGLVELEVVDAGFVELKDHTLEVEERVEGGDEDDEESQLKVSRCTAMEQVREVVPTGLKVTEVAPLHC